MKMASLGLLEVILVRAYPQGTGIPLSSLFGVNNPFGFAIFSRADVEDSFLASRQSSFLRTDIKLFLAPKIMLFLVGSCLGSVSRGQLLWSFAGGQGLAVAWPKSS
jgi:hypothetical protein